MKVTIDLTEAEAHYLRTCCVLRVVKAAAEAAERDPYYDYLDELTEAGQRYEVIRNKIVEELRKR